MDCSSLSVAAVAIRLLVGGLLVISGFLKARRPANAITAVSKWLGDRPRLGATVVRVVTLLEIVLGVLLVAGIQIKWTAPAAALFFLAVNVPVIMLMRAKYAGGCGCFGDSDRRLDKADVARNCLLAMLSLGVAYRALTEVPACAAGALWSLDLATAASSTAIALVVALSWALAFAGAAGRQETGWVGE